MTFSKRTLLRASALGLLLLSSAVWQACGDASMSLDASLMGRGGSGIGQGGASAGLSFVTDTAPIFKKRCFDCHGAGKMNANDWQDYGTVKAKYEKILTYINSGYMPLNRPKLPDSEIATIQGWVKAGMIEVGTNPGPAPTTPSDPTTPPSPTPSMSPSPAPSTNPSPAPGPDVNAGKALYTTNCYFCHGEKGMSAAPQYPNLAGQKEAYIALQLKDFRDKVRPGSMMPSMAMNLTDAQIDNLSAYISSLKCN